MKNSVKDRAGSLQFVKWILIGLLIRFVLMPFTFHGSDIFFNYYPSFKLMTQGALDPYLYIKQHFPDLEFSYYLPISYYIFSATLAVIKFFLPNLDKLYSLFEFYFFNVSYNTVQYADLLKNSDLFRTLFLFKIPYLIADFIAGYALVRLLRENQKQSLTAFKIWMLNPFVLHSCYMVGQSDIIPLSLVMLAVLCILKNKPYVSIVFLCLAAGTKGYPALLIPIVILLTAKTFKDMVKLSLTALACAFIIIFPFYMSSKLAFLGSFHVYSLPLARKAVFFGSYLLLLLGVFFYMRRKGAQTDCLVNIFIISLLLFYATYIVTLRNFILVTPFLIYAALKNKRFWIYNLIFLITLFWLRTAGNTQQAGLFSPLSPEFFSSLPTQDSFINVVYGVRPIHQVSYRLFLLSSIAMGIHLIIAGKRHYLSCAPRS